jgi:hemolysin III
MSKKNSVSIKVNEIINSMTHLVGLGLSVTALILMIVRSSLHGTPISIVSACVFGASLIILYLASTLYHGAKNLKIKRILNKLDHSAIYVLIAGTYTPFSIVLLQGGWGWSIFGVQWGLAIAGIIFKVFWYKPKYRKISAWAYIGMGLVIIVALQPLIDKISTGGLIWLSVGGAVYIVGVFFYLTKKIPFSHGIWHLFVMGGSLAHFFAIYNYVLPNLAI